MANQSISINTEAAYSVMTYVANSCTILESDVSSKLSSGFDVLTSLGFLSSLSTIQNQVSTLIKAHQSIVSEISSHMSTAQEQEENLVGGYQNHTYGGTNGGYSGGSYNGGEAAVSDSDQLQVDDVDDGKKLTADKLGDMLVNIGDEYRNLLVELINANKDDNVSLIDLLMDNKNSKELYKVLKKIFGESINIENMTLEDYEKIRRAIIDMIVKADVDIPLLSEKTILLGKDYLQKVCSDNNIDPSKLLFDDEYRQTLKNALIKMYIGGVDDTMNEDAINNFKEYIDQIAADNNISVTDLLTNHVELIK